MKIKSHGSNQTDASCTKCVVGLCYIILLFNTT